LASHRWLQLLAPACILAILLQLSPPQSSAAIETTFPASESSLVEEVGRLTNISPLLERLRAEQRALKSKTQSPSSTAAEGSARAVALQRIIYLHTKINTYLETAHLEVDSVVGKLNAGLAELADRRAMISDEQARILRRNSFINLISGGLTKIGGYSVALTPASLIPTNILEVFDGTVQTSLSALTLKQQRQESKLSKARPPILSSFLRGDNLTSHLFPGTVWSFLNEKAAASSDGKTRRQKLIDHWLEIGRLSNGQRLRKATPSNSQIASSLGPRFRLDELDDTVAMTSDLKSIVSAMEEGLMTLGELARDSYMDDPDI
jgi:hypothetical protein